MQEAAQTQKNMLKLIERQILSNFEVNKYQIRQLLDCLTSHKPHFQILKYYKDERQSNKSYMTRNNNTNSYNICLNIEVYDQNEKVNKFMQIFLLNTYISPEKMFFVSQSLVKKLQRFGHSNLILMPLSSYLLEDSKNVDSFSSSSSESELIEKDFFIVEYEAFDLTLREYCSTFEVNDNQISDLIKSQINYVKQITQIEFQCGEIFPYENVFIKVDDSQQITLRLNLMHINPFDELERAYTYSQYQEETVKKYQKMVENNNKFNTQQYHPYNMTEEKRGIIQEHTQQMKNNNFSSLRDQLNQPIHKDNLIVMLKAQNPKIYQYHQVAIFEIIARHPKYAHFEIVEIDQQRFTFNITKNNGNSLELEGKKYVSIDQAQQLQQQYEKLINASETKQITTITSSELIVTDNGKCYILLERDRNPNDFISFLQTKDLEAQENDKDFTKEFVLYLEKLVQLSYTLFSQHSIQITTINPFKIVLQDLEDSRIELNIQDFNVGEYSFEYIKILQQYSIYRYKKIEDHVKSLYQQFFRAISQKNINEFELTYQQIQRFIKQSTKLIDLEKEAKLFQFDVTISFGDSQNMFEDFEIVIQNFIFNRESVKAFQNLLNSHSFISVEMDKSIIYEQILRYKRKENNEEENHEDRKSNYFDSLQVEQIKSFFQKREAKEKKEEEEEDQYYGDKEDYEQQVEDEEQYVKEFKQALKDLIDIYEIDMKISIDNYSLKDKEILFIEEEMEEENLLNLAKDVLKDNEQCLKLSFSPSNSNNESCVIRIIQKENKAIIILCESPFIVQYQHQIDFLNIEDYFLKAEWYQNLKSILPTNAQIPQNCYEDMCFLQLSMLLNLTYLKELYLVEIKPMLLLSNYENYKQLLSRHQNLQYIHIKLGNTYQLFSRDANTERLLFFKLQELISQLPILNTLQFESLVSRDRILILYSILSKVTKLVKFRKFWGSHHLNQI